MELLQNYLPQRVASNVDLLLNAMGTALGVVIGLLLRRRAAASSAGRWCAIAGSSPAAPAAWRCSLLWPIGLLFPTAVPFGLGHVLGRVPPVVAELLQGTPAEAWADGLGRRRRGAGGRADDALGGERARDHRPRPARALPGGLHDRRAGLAAQSRW